MLRREVDPSNCMRHIASTGHLILTIRLVLARRRLRVGAADIPVTSVDVPCCSVSANSRSQSG